MNIFINVYKAGDMALWAAVFADDAEAKRRFGEGEAKPGAAPAAPQAPARQRSPW